VRQKRRREPYELNQVKFEYFSGRFFKYFWFLGKVSGESSSSESDNSLSVSSEELQFKPTRKWHVTRGQRGHVTRVCGSIEKSYEFFCVLFLDSKDNVWCSSKKE
jgi:hypothetical protein